MPTLAHLLPADEGVHRLLSLLVAALGGLALVRGYVRHCRAEVVALMAAGLALVGTAAWMGDRVLGHAAEVGLTVAGSAVMILAHRRNHTFCQACVCTSGCATGTRPGLRDSSL